MNSAIEKTIFDWIVYCAQLTVDRIIWRDENGTTPDENQFITLQITNLSDVHRPSVDERYEPANSNGEQIVKKYSVLREFDLEVTCYSKQVNGDSSARALVSSMMSRKDHDASNLILKSGKISISQAFNVQHLPQLDEVDFIGRAIWIVKMYYVGLSEEKTTFIETINVTNLLTGTSHTIKV